MIYGRDYSQSPICADGDHECASTEECIAGLMGCDHKRFCEEHITRCVGCDDAYCRADASRFLDGDRLCGECQILRDEGVDRCPNCGRFASFTEHTAEHIETHGLDCGPYEHWTDVWLKCSECGAETDERELRRTNEPGAAA